jgi:hypothetical protein
MANVTTLKIGGTTGRPGTYPPIPVLKAEINIAKAVAAGLATTEYVKVLDIPANTRLKIWAVRNATALSLGSSPRLDLGDADDDDLYVSNASTLTVNTNHALTGDTAISATARTEKTYSAAGELRLKVTGGTLTSGVVQIVYSLIDLGRNPQAVPQA